LQYNLRSKTAIPAQTDFYVIKSFRLSTIERKSFSSTRSTELVADRFDRTVGYKNRTRPDIVDRRWSRGWSVETRRWLDSSPASPSHVPVTLEYLDIHCHVWQSRRSTNQLIPPPLLALRGRVFLSPIWLTRTMRKWAKLGK